MTTLAVNVALVGTGNQNENPFHMQLSRTPITLE